MKVLYRNNIRNWLSVHLSVWMPLNHEFVLPALRLLVWIRLGMHFASFHHILNVQCYCYMKCISFGYHLVSWVVLHGSVSIFQHRQQRSPLFTVTSTSLNALRLSKHFCGNKSFLNLVNFIDSNDCYLPKEITISMNVLKRWLPSDKWL